MMKMFRGAAMAAACLVASSAQAYEKFDLYAKGAWEAALEVFPNGRLVCSASVFNGASIMSLNSFQGHPGIHVLVTMEEPQTTYERSVDAYLQVQGHKTFTVFNATLKDHSLNFVLASPDGAQLIQQIAEGSLLMLGDSTARTIATWPLDGSYGAILEMSQCMERLG